MLIEYSRPIPPIPSDRLIEFSCRFITDGDCKIWTSSRLPDGYGYFSIAGRKVRIHRIAYFLHTGVDPIGFCVLHTCDRPLCGNGDHLFLGDNIINSEDRDRKGRNATGEKHGTRIHGTLYLPRGIDHHASKLTPDLVRLIREQHTQHISQLEIARRIGVKPITIWKVIHRVTWSHVS